MNPTPKFLPLVAVTLALFLIVSSINAMKSNRYIGSGITPTNTISVSGEGDAYAIPDIATFSFGAQATDKTVADAQAKVTTIINSALDKVKAGGVAPADIQTTDYSAYPQYEYSNSVCNGGICPPSHQTLTGYTVSQTITVKVRAVDNAGTLLGSIGGTGVTNVSSLNFTVDDPSAVQNEARTKAIADAKTKAHELAKELGVSLVRVVSFSEGGNGGVTPIYMKADAMASGSVAPTPQIPVGQNKVTSDVTITYEIR